MTQSVLLSHSIQNALPSDYYFSYVRPATPSELSRAAKQSLPTSFFADEKKKTVFIDNPILTDVTQEPHTNIHTILSQNPDVNGLSLILDDTARQQLQETVSVNDFLEPASYYDVFDIQDFVDNAKRSFELLPASLRKQFNNNPMELVSRIDKRDQRALSALQEYLGIDNVQSALQAADANSGSQKKVDDSAAPPVDNNKE